MIVSCAGCGTKYKVSDDKVGHLGIRVRCPKCRTVFEVKRPEEEKPESLAEKLFGRQVVTSFPSDAAPAAEPRAAAPTPSAPPERKAEAPERKAAAPEPLERKEAAAPPTQPEARPREAEPVCGPEPAERQEPAVSQEPVVSKETAGTAAPAGRAPQAGAAGRPSAFPFKVAEEEPGILARALVSDILFYNRDSRDRGLAEGKTLAYLGKEIARSWDTYKERVGVETAVETDFFRRAVNDILGEGREIL